MNDDSGTTKHTDLLYPDESYRIVGACFEVYRENGCGFLEAVFQECLEMEEQRIPFVARPVRGLSYKGGPLRQTYSPDFICYGNIVLEIKAVSKLTDEHRAQTHAYLRATGNRLRLLANFGHYPKLEYERIVI